MPKVLLTALQHELEREAFRQQQFNTALLARKANGLDHQEIAAVVGVSPTTVAKWKSDCGKMTLSYFRKFSEAANLSDEEILLIVRGKKH